MALDSIAAFSCFWVDNPIKKLITGIAGVHGLPLFKKSFQCLEFFQSF